MLENLNVDENIKPQFSFEAKILIKKIKTDFEENMNNDLQVKSAFDSLYTKVSRLFELQEKQMLNTEDSKEALERLKAIDYVLQVIF